MNSNDDKPFREMERKEKITTVIIVFLLISLPLSFVLGVTYFGFAGFFGLFGGEYDSWSSLLFFVIFLFLLGLVFDSFSKVFVKILKSHIQDTFQFFLLKFLINCTFNWLAIYTIDEFMDSILIPFTVEMIIVIFMFFLEEALEGKEE